jgi:hypothetical protein
LREKLPVDVELPDTRCVANDGRHDDDDDEREEGRMMKEDVVVLVGRGEKYVREEGRMMMMSVKKDG